MAVSVMTPLQASDMNIVASLWQFLYQNVKIPYDIAALAAGLNQGLTLNQNGTYTPDTTGLGLLDTDIDRDDFYQRVPVVGFVLDDIRTRHSTPTGAGDGANNEWRSVLLRAVPALRTAPDGTQAPDKMAHRMLKTYLWNAIGRSFIMPIVDNSQARVSNKFPQIGYAEIHGAEMPRPPSFKNQLVIDRRDFDVLFELKMGVATSDGL